MYRCVIPDRVLEELVAQAVKAPRGDIVEVGVYQGGSASLLERVALDKGVSLHLFDTFSGMPSQGPDDIHKIGDFADTSMEEVQRRVPFAQFYPGVFPSTLPHALQNLGFVHCDVDQYSCTYAVINSLWPRLVSGGIMWFDDGELEPARRAMNDYFRAHYGEEARAFVFEAAMQRYYAVKP